MKFSFYLFANITSLITPVFSFFDYASLFTYFTDDFVTLLILFDITYFFINNFLCDLL
jgi:hypothetical protein